ncbi:MAG: hypothetical protein PHX04_02875 [Bacilli bacterium]|nr:hypothetical protein [Bacilli bacterium]
MKVVRLLSIFIISLFLINVEVNAAKGTHGICYNEKIVEQGYCRLASPVSNITAVTYTLEPYISSEHKLYYDDGFSPAYDKYFGMIDGKKEILFCYDPNVTAPTSNYPFAKSINLDHKYDVAIAKVYQMYINDSVSLKNAKGITFEAASSNYLQAANVAMRAITKKFGFDIKNSKINKYNNVVNQLDGRSAKSPKLRVGDDKTAEGKVAKAAYNLVKRYYSSALSATSNSLTQFKFTFNLISKDIKDVNAAADKFEKIIPIKINGIQKLYSEAYKNTNPSFYITGIDCGNDKLVCTSDSVGKNLVLYNKNNQKDYTIYVKVSGKKSDFKNQTPTNIAIKYKYHHILNVENLAFIRNSFDTTTTTQRLLALMPNREQGASMGIKINLPAMCEVREKGGIISYYYGGTKKSELEYLQAGCCNVKPNKLKNEKAIEHYMGSCATQDLVILDTKCDNDGDLTNPSRSILKQLSIDKTLRLINNAEKMYQQKAYSKADLKSIMKQTDNYRDDVYMASLIAKGNDYCSLYTSESQVIEFPGTAEATSGRFFIFDEGQQPKVEGKIMLNFHTNYNRWKTDYEAAIAAEKGAYTRWQEALNLNDAISVASANGRGRTCTYCCKGYTKHYDEDGKYIESTCNGECYPTYKYYSGSTAGTYYRADSSVISKASASWETSTACSGTKKPNAEVSYYKTLYNTAKNKRKKLESFKTDCERKANLANNWNYYLAPDLYFNYKQEYYKNNKMVSTSLDQPIQLEASYKAEKYWPNVSTAVNQIPGTKTYKSGSERFRINYGKVNSVVNETFNFDTTTDYKIGYEQTLYYKPTVKYYGLLPDGYYVTDVTKYQSENLLDVGYVFNVEITNYTNQYLTWFSMKNIGHLMRDTSIKPKLKSNLQKSMDKAITEIDDKAVLKIYNNEQLDSLYFNNICYYNNEQILYKPDCPTCIDFSPQYFTRTIAKENMFPNEGVKGRITGANWASTKGNALEEEISNNGDLIYSDIDGSKGFLEGSFTLTPTMMNTINKEYNKGKNYSDFNLNCKSGKECESPFLTDLVKNSDNDKVILENNRINGWRYFVDGKWERGSISSLLDGNYPEENARLTDWP